MDEQTSQTDLEPAAPRRGEPVFNMPAIVLSAIALCVAVHVLCVYVLTDAQYIALLERAAFIPVRYSGQYRIDVYAFTSTVTYAFLHGGWTHLAVNMVWLAAFGSPLANRIGALRFCIFWVFTGLAAVALHWALHRYDQAPVIGASGAISGMMGAAARFGFRMQRIDGRAAFAGPPLPIRLVLHSRSVMAFLGVWMVVNLATGLFGLTPGITDQIAWEAHVGGFLAGFFGVKPFLGATEPHAEAPQMPPDGDSA